MPSRGAGLHTNDRVHRQPHVATEAALQKFPRIRMKDSVARRPKLPWMSKEQAQASLLEAARRIEAGETLHHGDAGGGCRYIERELVVEALRAFIAGKSLGQAFQVGRPPMTGDWKLLHEVAEKKRQLGSQAAAFQAIAKVWGRTPAAIKKSYQRLAVAERDRFRKQFLAGEWPSGYWNMSDEEIDREVAEDGFNYINAKGEPVDMAAQLRLRRFEEREEIKALTGWSTIPSHEGH